MWFKNALTVTTGISPEKLKFILPTVAYYFTNGPFRNQWVRFGYDPRKNPDSAMHQTLDYRIRLHGGGRSVVKAKRNYANYVLPYKVTNPSKPKSTVIDRASFSAIPSEGSTSVLSRTTEISLEEQERKKDLSQLSLGKIDNKILGCQVAINCKTKMQNMINKISKKRKGLLCLAFHRI